MVCHVGLAFSFATLGSLPVAADDAGDWSTRLLQEKARIERFQQRLDAAKSAYAKALVSRDAPEQLGALQDELRASADSLADAERGFPALVQAARADGAPEEILRPYRFASPPAATE